MLQISIGEISGSCVFDGDEVEFVVDDVGGPDGGSVGDGVGNCVVGDGVVGDGVGEGVGAGGVGVGGVGVGGVGPGGVGVFGPVHVTGAAQCP